MSTLWGFSQGQTQSTDPLLIAATDTDLLTPGATNGGTAGFEIAVINFACGAATTLTLKVYNASAVLVGNLITTKALTANDVFLYEFPFVLKYGYTLKALASIANNITATVTYVSVKK